jgi:hypothetical protein
MMMMMKRGSVDDDEERFNRIGVRPSYDGG